MAGVSLHGLPQSDNSQTGYTEQDADMIERDRRALITTPNFDGSLLPDGSWYNINRPLATDYVTPGRGHEGHGADNDTTVDGHGPGGGVWSPDQSGEIPLMSEQYDPEHPGWADVEFTGTPLYVKVLPNAAKVITRGTQFRTLVPANVSYTTPLYQPAPTAWLMGLSRDEGRVKTVFRVASNVETAFANLANQYAFAISHDPTFSLGNYITVGGWNNTGGTSFEGNASIEFEGTEPVFVTIIPQAAFDGTKQNFFTLGAVVQTASILDVNPAAKTI